jgi:DNA end-binding protein Ku
VRPQELEMARALVENLAASWEPGKYTDDYRENLMKVIRAKMKGRAPKLAMAEEPQSAEVVDLMERLRRSLEGAQGGRKKAPAKTARAKKAPAARANGARPKKKRAA